MSKKRNYPKKKKQHSNDCNNKQKCDAHCIYFPNYVDKYIEYEIWDGVKHRVNSIPYVCAYDGHTIRRFCACCENKKTVQSIKKVVKINGNKRKN